MNKKAKELKRRIEAAKNLPKFLRTSGRHCPWIKKLLFSKSGEHPLAKRIAGFFFGVVLAAIFYQFIIKELEFTPLTTGLLSITILLLLSVGCAISSQLRCTCLLTFPAFCGRAGRGALKALVIAYVIAGPVTNLTANTKEVIRSFACTVTLTYNLTKTRFVLMFKPFQEALMGVKVDTSEIKETLNSVRDLAVPIVNEIEEKKEVKVLKEVNDYIDELKNDTKRSWIIDLKYSKPNLTRYKKIEGDYFTKLEHRCEGVLSAADSKCKRVFKQAEEGCYEKLHWAVSFLVCWVMKLDFVCNVVGMLGGDSACDAAEEISSGFGSGYTYMIDSKSMLASEFKTARIQYQIQKPNIKIDIRGAADTAKAVVKEFQGKKSMVDSIIVLVKRVLTLVFVKIIINAQKYQDGYLSSIQFDNVYITKYFRKIDARRRIAGKHTLLPLKKMEKSGFIDPHSLKLFAKEKSHVMGQSIKIILEMVTATTIVLIDRLFYESLDLIRRHGKIEYHQSGIHDLIIIVDGTGMIANVVRSIIKNFNFRKRIEEDYTNEFCLPKPRFPEWSITKKIYGTYTIIFLMIIVEGYIQRARRMICAFFYPKREKKRVLYLYNETLKQRKGFYKYMKKKIRRIMRENKLTQDISYLLMLRLKFPNLFGWLSWFENAKRKCLICGEYEKKSRPQYECPACMYIYCLECWNDIDKTCYACNPPSTDEEASDEEPQPADR
ncbi:protein sneaky [Halyomorpha halys]|uniref:protein sneaky n=1 Tax=Halyomorpha halys TaxID=286706 RepID=UPI0006D4FE8F|nr:E3 ubiquitin-protein ligase DCST1 [Halyomorpha halys]XP_014288715.1 E3 ubiquitin-protein ligase DCST1 [Halyomorpha halys]